jgi:RimJ/RimL family protein N-acetyltransferase
MAGCHLVELGPHGMTALANIIGEAPDTVMAIHALRQGRCRAWTMGKPGRDWAAVVQHSSFPDEPFGFGEEPRSLMTILSTIGAWTAVCLPLSVGERFARLLESETGRACSLTEEIYSTLERLRPVPVPASVRLLTERDLNLMMASDDLGMGDWRFGSAQALLQEGVVAGAVVGDQLAAVAFTAGIGDRYADVGVVTHQDWRGRGLATACAASVCSELLQRGLVPVWGTPVENHTSRRVAEKLGFEEVSRRVYVNAG